MTQKIYNVLFLCTGNSARSIMAEKLLEHWGKGNFKAYSAGSFPTGKVNPFAIKLLELKGLSTEGLRSKSWNEFTTEESPKLDFVITVCDNAAGEVCPYMPGVPMTAHWGVKDPAAVEGSDEHKLAEFRRIAGYLENRIKAFTALPIEKLDAVKLKNEIDEIGDIQDQ